MRVTLLLTLFKKVLTFLQDSLQTLIVVDWKKMFELCSDWRDAGDTFVNTFQENCKKIQDTLQTLIDVDLKELCYYSRDAGEVSSAHI